MTPVERDAEVVRKAAGGEVDVALVLGSGLGSAIGRGFERVTVPYSNMNSIAFSPLAGHGGEALAGTWASRRVLAFSGRAHLYQGFTAEQVTASVRLAKCCGARALVLTNAAGALDPAYDAGDLMLVSDHLNLTGTNPLLGNAAARQFVDMSDAYAPRLRAIAKRHAARSDRLREGVYVGLLGPSYETPAEARYLRTIGGDAVGMSTVLETIMARALEMEVVAFSLITNMVGAAETTHEEVTATANAAAPRLAALIEKVLPEI
jgi:purine-nucleoside phosphorylase